MPGELVELYRARGLHEAYALADRLETAGISAVVDGEHLQGVVGEVPGGWVTAPRVLIAEEQLEAGTELLNGFLRPAGDESAAGLNCLACEAPMGQAVQCPACGWTYGANSAEPLPTAPATESADDSDPTATGPLEPVAVLPATPVSPRALLAEVGVVVAIGVIPRLLDPLTLLAARGPSLPPPYWIDAVILTVQCACTSFAVLYLIARSGEPWARFGLDSPRGWDLPLGLAMVAVSEVVRIFERRLGFFADMPMADPFPQPAGPSDFLLGVVKFGTAGFMEELIFRAYLITRLATLFDSNWRAVVVAAALFAAGHGYQGPRGVILTFLFGLAYGGVYLGARRIWPLAVGHALTNLIWDYGR